MTLDEILKLAEEFEKQSTFEVVSDKNQESSVKDDMEHARKHAEVKIHLNQIKKLCDLVDAKYKTSGKSKGLFSIFDSSYHNTLSGIRKAKKELEDIVVNLDKNS